MEEKSTAEEKKIKIKKLRKYNPIKRRMVVLRFCLTKLLFMIILGQNLD